MLLYLDNNNIKIRKLKKWQNKICSNERLKETI